MRGPAMRRCPSAFDPRSYDDCHRSSLAAKRVETAVASYPPTDMVRSFSSLGSLPSKRAVAPGIALAACTLSIGLASAQEPAAPPLGQNPPGTPSASAPATMTSPPGTTGAGTTAAGTPLPAPNSMASIPAQEHANKTLTLQSAERWALDNSTEVRIAKAQTGIADAQVEEFRAPLLPQVTASGQISYGTTRVVSTGTGTSAIGSSNSPNWYWSAGATGTQLIYDFGQAGNHYGAAKKVLESTRDTENTTKLQVVLDVRKAYFNARADYELVDVARQTLQDQNTHLAQVQGFVTVGTQPQIALAQQKAAVANAQVQLVTAQNNYETAKAQLNQAMGIQGDTSYDVGEEQLQPLDEEEKPLATLIQKAVEARPEMASLARQSEADERNVSAAKGAYGPTLNLSGSANELSGATFDSGIFVWSLGLLATWPIFQGGLTQGEVHQAQATLSMAQAQLTQEALQVRFDVTTAQLAVAAAKATIGSAQEAAVNAHEQRRLADQRFATGVGSIIELFDAQVADTAAATQLVQARYQLSSARAQLLWALGRT
jgi:outer membrane protein